MNTSLVRYVLDPTGTNPDNLVVGEPHTLSDLRNRVIAPVFGAFFTEGCSVVDTDNNNRVLIRGIDYVFAELYQSLTLKFGKEVCGLIIVINRDVGSHVKVTYQAVGSQYVTSAEGLKNLLEELSDTEFSNSYFDIRNRPDAFVPSPHVHDLGDGYGFEFLVYALEKIRNAIIWADMRAIDSLMTQVFDFLENLQRNLNYRIDTEILAALFEFKRSLTKASIGLGNVQNLGIATIQQGRDLANPDYNLPSNNEDKYITMVALSGFKEVLYNQMVAIGTTNLGRGFGVLAIPLKTVIASMPNGARIMIDAYETTKSTNSPLDIEVYPDPSKGKVRWTIVKVSNNATDRGGVLIAFNMSTGEMYSGQMRALPNGFSIKWKRYLTEDDATGFLDALIEHMEHPGDPHKTRKYHVGLGDVENLPVASREDIVCRKPVRKYVTYDGMLLFFKSFLTGVSTIDDIEEDPNSPSAMERYQMIFAPCGPCGGYGGTPVTSPPTTAPPVRPRGELLTSYCMGYKRVGRYADGFGGSYEETITELSRDCGWDGNDWSARGSLLETYCETFEKVGKYADGAGGFYTRTIAINSPDCGYVAKYIGTYEIADITNETILGIGFSFTDRTDPLATVTLFDELNNPLCMIYPQPGEGHTIQINDAAGQLIGYAMNPE